MTFQEITDDARSSVAAYSAVTGITVQQCVRWISEALHELAKETLVSKKTVTVDTADLDSAGTIALDKNITVPFRCFYTPRGQDPITSRFEVTLIGPDDMAKKQVNISVIVPIRSSETFGAVIYATIEQNKIFFYPWKGLDGTFTFTAYAKMPVYALSRVTDANSFWYQWDNTNIGSKFSTVLIPQEFEDAEEGITAYVAARMLQTIPGWKRHYKDDYNEYMARFAGCADSIKANQPSYPASYSPAPNWGW